MPKRNQIPGLFPSKKGPPGTVYHWKPSKTQRAAGWANLRLGTDWGAAIKAADARNDEVAAARAAAKAQPIGAGAPAASGASNPLTARRATPQRARWRDLVRDYKADERYRSLKPKSRREYDSCLRTLGEWALDGDLRLDQLDRPMIVDLRDTLVNHDRRPYRTAGLLRVLSLLLQFAEDKGTIPSNPARALNIPTPPKRTRRLLRDQIAPLLEAADDLGHHHVRLGIVLGFYTMQREADLLASTSFRVRAIDDLSSDARRALAGADGKVLALFLQQEKTDAWVAIPFVPVARQAVEAALAARAAYAAAAGAGAAVGTHLIPDRVHAGAACPDFRFQRDFRETVTHAAARATEGQQHDLARLYLGNPEKKRDAIQFRDLRRSGMCWLRELHVPVPLIASISGHSIEETQKILDTYMPRDTRAAAEGMAIAVARQARRDADVAAEREAEEGR
jgi:hypothetical protein